MRPGTEDGFLTAEDAEERRGRNNWNEQWILSHDSLCELWVLRGELVVRNAGQHRSLRWRMKGLSPGTVILSGAVLAAAALGCAGINPYLPGGGDNAAYIAEAESWLATGQRKRLYEAGTPPATLKPPLFPVILAGVERLLGRNVAAMKVVLALFAAGAVWAAWWALRCGLEEGAAGDREESTAKSTAQSSLLTPLSAPAADTSRQAALLALWFALAPTLTLTAHDVLSDVPFAFLALVAIGCTGRAARPQASYRALILPAAVLTLATFMRSAGVLAAGSCAAYMGLSALLRRKESCVRRLLVGCIVLAALACALLWYQQRGEQTYSHFITEGGRPAGQPGEALLYDTSYGDSSPGARLLRKAGFYCVFLPAEVGGYEGLGPQHAVYVLAFMGCALAAIGIVTMLRHRQLLIPLCFLLLQAPLLFIPWVSPRYYLPALPLWLCLLWVGAGRIVRVLSAGVLSTEREPTPGSPRVLSAGVLSTERGPAPGSLSTSARLAGLAFVLATIPSVSLCGTWLDFGRSKAESVTIVEWIVGPVALAGLLLWAWLAAQRVLSAGVLSTGRGSALGNPIPSTRYSVLSTQYFARRRILGCTFGVFLVLAASRSVSENVVRERLAGPAPAGAGWRDLYDAARWLKEHAGPGEAVASDRMSLVWFWAGLQGVPIPRSREQAQAERQLRPAQWIIVDGLEEDQVAARYLEPYLANAPDAWLPCWHRNRTWVLCRKPDHSRR